MRADGSTAIDRGFQEDGTGSSEWPTIGESLRAAVERFGDSDALVELEHGVRQGEAVGIWSQGRYEWVVTQLAIARVGALLVTIDPACDQRQLEQQLDTGGVGVLMMARAHGGPDRVQMVVDALRGCPRLRRAIVFESDWEWFLSRGDSVGDDAIAAREASLELDDPINIVFSPCSIDDFTVATHSHRDVLCRTCLTSHDGHTRGWMPMLYQRLGTILGSIVCAAHPACVTI